MPPLLSHHPPHTRTHTPVITGDEGYGRPPPGSKTEARGKEALDWVEQEVNRLVDVIK